MTRESDAMTRYLQFDNLSKTFPGVRALGDVSFGVGEGSIHALMGENGAGKSTLLKILAGAHKPDAGGVLRIGGAEHVFASTGAAIAAGVAVIYQELQLVPSLSVAENLFLGHLPSTGGFLRRGPMLAESRKLLRMLGEDIDPGARLGSLPIGQRQMVEIAKALAHDAKVIAFDEPTSSLSAHESEKLFGVIRQLRDAGKVVLYVSHRMDEIYALCDAATVLRDGRHVETFDDLSDVSRDTLVQRMVGREISDLFRYRPREVGGEVLRVEGVTGPGLRGPAELSVRRGEIVGMFGLIGAGRTELLRLLFGSVSRTGGTVTVDGQRLGGGGPPASIARGMVLCPEDRKAEGIVAIRSVRENLNLSVRRRFSPLGFFISPRAELRNATEGVRRLGVRTASLGTLLGNLSGGNQQKVVLARGLREEPKVILLDEPTRGIDVGAKSEIYSIIYDLAESGVGVVMVSSELPEVMGVCDRALVMRDGRIVGRVGRADFSQERLLSLALPEGGNAVQDDVQAEAA